MKRFPVSCVLAVAALSLLTGATRVHAEERPFRASGSGFLQPSPIPSLLGDGQVTHLGLSSLGITLDREAWLLGDLVPRSLVLSAADGDLLLTHVDADFDPDTGIIAGVVTFVGGTGRFADATASADLLIVFDESFNFDFGLEGTIDY